MGCPRDRNSQNNRLEDGKKELVMFGGGAFEAKPPRSSVVGC